MKLGFKLFPKTYSAKDIKRDFQDVFNTEEGKRALKHLEVYCGAFNPNNPTGLTIQDVAYNEGLRAVYLHIRNLLTIDILTEVENDRSYYTANKPNTRSNSLPNPDPSRR